jgi:hypothetical protein
VISVTLPERSKGLAGIVDQPNAYAPPRSIARR